MSVTRWREIVSIITSRSLKAGSSSWNSLSSPGGFDFEGMTGPEKRPLRTSVLAFAKFYGQLFNYQFLKFTLWIWSWKIFGDMFLLDGMLGQKFVQFIQLFFFKFNALRLVYRIQQYHFDKWNEDVKWYGVEQSRLHINVYSIINRYG
jgi:hypothetical protein